MNAVIKQINGDQIDGKYGRKNNAYKYIQFTITHKDINEYTFVTYKWWFVWDSINICTLLAALSHIVSMNLLDLCPGESRMEM